jgi:hypothetical protein
MRSDASGSTSAEGSRRTAPRDTPSDRSIAIESTKFDLGAPPAPFDGAELPWGYGESRITALVRSPDSLYLTWEIIDEAIADARRRLGSAGQWGWFNLRVYDTTGHEFDGTNANEYFDIHVERGDRDYFLLLGRPGSSFHIEIGIKSHEGYFQPIARSGRADFPRKSPSPNNALEWMTVTSDTIHPTARPYQSKYKGPPPGTYQEHRGHHEQGERTGAALNGHTRAEGAEETRSWTWEHPSTVEVRWEGPWIWTEWRAEWRTRWLGVAMRVFHPGGPLATTSWRIDPFPVMLIDPDRLEIRFMGDTPMMLEEAHSGLEVLGPWQIVIRSFDASPERRVLGTWRMHWVRVSPPKVERWWASFEHRRVGAFRREHIVGGASEAHMLVEGGASEMWRMGASERMLLGASEWLAMGGSEVMWLGGSELAFGGASALFYAGASERMLLGGSERAWLGASERMLGGASEAWGSSAPWLGGSERWFVAGRQ